MLDREAEMISKETYNKIKRKYGKSASWAVWAEEGDTPKSNVGDLSIFNNDKILKELNPHYVFVGLNPSVQNTAKGIWRNFHSTDAGKQNDYKLRYALKNTRFWGSYLTDLIPNLKKTKSKEVPNVLPRNIKKFKEEITLLGAKPILIAMGDRVYRDLNRYLKNEFTIIKIKHSAFYMSKEDYRKDVLSRLKNG